MLLVCRGNAYGGEPLAWSDSLAASAQQWANYMLLFACNEPNSPVGDYGRTVAYRTPGSDFKNGQTVFAEAFVGADPFDPGTAAQMWISEGDR